MSQSQSSGHASSELSSREQFLLEMYKECSGHLDRHVGSVWEFFTVLAAAATALTVERDQVVFDYAVSMAIGVCVWFGCSIIDASSWFNRNIAIITNIERLFLNAGDVVRVHKFFKPPHREPTLIGHFKVHLCFAFALSAGLVALHAEYRLMQPDILWAVNSRALPFAVFCCGLVAWFSMCLYYSAQQRRANLISPGIPELNPDTH